MRKCERNTSINAVELERLPNGKTRVLLHDNIATDTRTDEGLPYVVYTADETEFITTQNVTVKTINANFAGYWYYAENGETKDEKYARLVDKYVREKYSQSNVEALTSNYLSNPELYKQDFDAFQVYRAECKERAKKEL